MNAIIKIEYLILQIILFTKKLDKNAIFFFRNSDARAYLVQNRVFFFPRLLFWKKTLVFFAGWSLEAREHRDPLLYASQYRKTKENCRVPRAQTVGRSGLQTSSCSRQNYNTG